MFISLPKIGSTKRSDRMAISVPTSGSMAALAAWNRKRAKVKTSKERLRKSWLIRIGAGSTVRLHDVFDYWTREQPAAEFAVAPGRSLTYGDAAKIAGRLASRLRAEGCRPGDRVAVLARNSPWYLLLYFAVAKAGLVLVPLNWRLAAPEWAAILADAEPSVLIADRAHVAAADELRPDLPGIRHFVGEGAAGRTGWADLDRWLAEHAEGIACVIGDPTFAAMPRVRSLAPQLAKGLEFDLVVLVDPQHFGEGIEGAVDRYVAMTRATQQLVVLTSP